MSQEIQLFQSALNGLGQEAALAELPGEFWPDIEALADREQSLFMSYCPPELKSSCPSARAVDIEKYLRLKGTAEGQDATLAVIQPYLSKALDAGYNYLILTA
jgi:hypothetical protein